MKKINLIPGKKELSREELKRVNAGTFPTVRCVCVYADGTYSTHVLYPPNCAPCSGICAGSASWGCSGGGGPRT